MGITLKIMTLTKYKDLKLMGLYLLKLLIKNDQVDSQNFSEIGTTCIEFLKKRDFKFATTAAKSLTYLFDKGLTLKLQASSVKKLFKKMLKIMNEQMNSELRRNLVLSFYSAFKLAYWIDTETPDRERIFDEDNYAPFVADLILQVRTLLEGASKLGENILVFTVYNLVEVLAVALPDFKTWFQVSSVQEVLEMFIENCIKVESQNLLISLRDTLQLFFQKIVSEMPIQKNKDIYDYVFEKLSRQRHKICYTSHPSYVEFCGEVPAQNGTKYQSQNQFQVVCYLRFWHFLLRLFGDDLSERLSDKLSSIFQNSTYLYSSDKIVQWCTTQCFLQLANINLVYLRETLSYFIRFFKEEQRTLKQLLCQTNKDSDRIAQHVVRLEGASNIISSLIINGKDDLFELTVDFPELVLNMALSDLQGAVLSHPTSEEASKMKEFYLIWRYVQAGNAWRLLTSLVKVSQKWVSLNIKDLLVCWKRGFEWPLKQQEHQPSSMYADMILASVATLLSFITSNPQIMNDKIKSYVSKVTTKLFKHISSDQILLKSSSPVLLAILKDLIIRVVLKLELRSVKPILNDINKQCFADLTQNIAFIDKIPNFLLDEEEQRLLRISFAELESYMIVVPNNTFNIETFRDGIETNPFYCSDNCLIYKSDNRGFLQKLSETQILMIGRAFNSDVISQSNKIKILEYIKVNLEEIIKAQSKPDQQNQKAKPFLFSLLCIANIKLQQVEENHQAEKWTPEILEAFLSIVQRCWSFISIQIRIVCALTYSKLLKIGGDSILEPAAMTLYKASSNAFERPTVAVILGFIFKYLSLKEIEPISNIVSNILIALSRDKENEISSKRFLFVALKQGFKSYGPHFTQLFEGCFPFLFLHYIENANRDKMTHWSICEWLSMYLKFVVAVGGSPSLGITTLLFDLSRTFFPYSFPVVDFAKIVLLQAVFQTQNLRKRFQCFSNLESRLLGKLNSKINMKVDNFIDFDLLKVEVIQGFSTKLNLINSEPLDLSFLLLDMLNCLNYNLEISSELTKRVQQLYSQLLGQQISQNAITLEEILHFYKSTLLPGNQNSSNSGETSKFRFTKPVLSLTQKFINSTFEGLLKNIDVGPLSSQEILSFSGLVYPFIIKMASSSSKSHREYGIPMLLYITKKMIAYNEEGLPLSKHQEAHDSLVQNYSAQLQAIIRDNLKTGDSNRASVMRKVHELFYYFYLVTYRNDPEMFFSQFNLFLRPTTLIEKELFRNDVYSRIKYLAILLFEGDSALVDAIVNSSSGEYWMNMFHKLILDAWALIFSSKIKKTKPMIATNRYELPNFSLCLVESMKAFLKLSQILPDESLSGDDFEHTLKHIEFLRLYLLPSITSVKKMEANLGKQGKEETMISFLNLKDRMFNLTELSIMMIELRSRKQESGGQVVLKEEDILLYHILGEFEDQKSNKLLIKLVKTCVDKCHLSVEQIRFLVELVNKIPESQSQDFVLAIQPLFGVVMASNTINRSEKRGIWINTLFKILENSQFTNIEGEDEVENQSEKYKELKARQLKFFREILSSSFKLSTKEEVSKIMKFINSKNNLKQFMFSILTIIDRPFILTILTNALNNRPLLISSIIESCKTSYLVQLNDKEGDNGVDQVEDSGFILISLLKLIFQHVSSDPKKWLESLKENMIQSLVCLIELLKISIKKGQKGKKIDLVLKLVAASESVYSSKEFSSKVDSSLKDLIGKYMILIHFAFRVLNPLTLIRGDESNSGQ